MKSSLALILIVLVCKTSFSTESNSQMYKIKVSFSELSNASFEKTCKDPLGNSTFYFTEKIQNQSAKKTIVSCGRSPITIQNCILQSKSAVISNEEGMVIGVSTDYGAVYIQDEDDYQNSTSFLSIKSKRESSKVELIDSTSNKHLKGIRDLILSRNPITSIAVREQNVMFHYGSCGCIGIETIYHDGELHQVGDFSKAYFTMFGCDKEKTEYFSSLEQDSD